MKTLIENKSKDKINYYFGRDEYQNPVVVFSKKNIVGWKKNVLIKKISQQAIYGEIDNKDGICSLSMSKIENLDQNFSLKKIDKDTINIKVFSNDILLSVVGEFNKNLNELEKLTKTKIFLGATQSQ